MKKIIYLLLFTLATSLTITSCTEEEVKPSIKGDSNGGAISTKI